MANKYMKRYSTLYVKRELQIKTVMKYPSTLIRMTEEEKIGNTKCW